MICFDVVPTAEQQSETILISGPSSKVEAARQALIERVAVLEKDKEDRVLKNFTLEVLFDFAIGLIVSCSVALWSKHPVGFLVATELNRQQLLAIGRDWTRFLT